MPHTQARWQWHAYRWTLSSTTGTADPTFASYSNSCTAVHRRTRTPAPHGHAHTAMISLLTVSEYVPRQTETPHRAFFRAPCARVARHASRAHLHTRTGSIASHATHVSMMSRSPFGSHNTVDSQDAARSRPLGRRLLLFERRSILLARGRLPALGGRRRGADEPIARGLRELSRELSRHLVVVHAP